MLRPSSAFRLWLVTLLFVFPAVARSTAPSKNSAPIPASPQPVEPAALLPQTFAGWQLTGAPQQATDPAAADNGDAVVLQEYGFTRYEAANYTRDGGSVAVKAMQFADATGAFGAFTFYRRPNMQPEQIGHDAAFDGVRVLFWQGTVLVDAKFDHLTAMSVAELRDLATELPKPVGNQGTLPTLPAYLPPQRLVPMTTQYAIGPQAYQLSGGVLPAVLVDFGRSAEVVTAQYNALNGMGVLTIIDYPTPEIAIDREHAIQNYFATHGQGQSSWTPALDHSNPAALQVRRSGPLVAVTSGSFSAAGAQQTLQRVHYEVNLTMSNRSAYVPDTSKVAQLILNIAVLVGIFALIAIVAGVSLGGGRVAWRKMRGKSALPEEESREFIRLNLKD